MRALAVSRQPAPPVHRSMRGGEPRLEDLPLSGLEMRAAAWDHLGRAAQSPTPFFTRPVVQAHAAAGLATGLRALVASRGDRLAAVLPYRSGAWFGLGRRARAAWRSPYTPSSTPLVAAEDLAGAVRLLFDGMAERAGVWLFPSLTLDDPVGLAMSSEADRRGWPSAVLGGFARPAIEARETWAHYLSDLGPRRRKDLTRRSRRLASLGDVRLETATAGPSLDAAVRTFLALEAAGWKGRSGTAMASRPKTAALAFDLFGRERDIARPRADVLTLDDRPIAASLAFISGETAYMLKAAYDETLARFSPGMVLEDAIVRTLHETGFARRLNSATGPSSHLEGIYPDRDSVGDLAILADPSVSRRVFARLVNGEEVRREALRRAKALYRWARPARGP